MTNEKLTQSSMVIAGLVALTCLPTDASKSEVLPEFYHKEFGKANPLDPFIHSSLDLTASSPSEADDTSAEALLKNTTELLKNTTDVPADFQETINQKFWDLLAQ